MLFLVICLVEYHNVNIYFIYNKIGGAATNKHQVTTKNTAKLDRETEELKHEKVPIDLGRLIQQGRQAKGFNQKELATVSSFFIL